MGVRDIQRGSRGRGVISPGSFRRPGRGVLKVFESQPFGATPAVAVVDEALTTTIFFRGAMCIKDGDLANGLYRG